MKKSFLLVLLCFFLLSFSGCAKYQPSDFVGKTSAQIEEIYGAFDCVGMAPSADGLYRSTSCGYTLREPRTGFLGTDPERLLFISFDENGVATACCEGYRPGG